MFCHCLSLLMKVILRSVLLNGKPCKINMDTAADHIIMSKSVYRRDFSHIPLRKSNSRLCTYTGHSLTVYGELLCQIVCDEQNLTLPLIVVDHHERPITLGRSWLAKLRLNWTKVFHVNHEEAGSPNARQRLNSMLKNKAYLFQDSYGGLKGHADHIRVKPEAKPVFHKPRRVPHVV